MHPPLELSRRALQSPESPISYLMEQGVSNPSVISLAAGLVDQESLPVAELEASVHALCQDPARARQALQYGTTNGLAALREHVADRLGKMDAHLVPAGQVILGTGSQQLLYLLGEILLDPGDIVLAAVPTYFVYMGALRSFGARIVPVASDDKGLIPDQLEAELVRLEASGELSRVKLIYDVSYFSNPTGLSLSADRRPAIVEIARRWSKQHRLLIVEDAAYRELRYEGSDTPSLRSFDPTGEYVIYAGTFSKPLAPGLRTGYLVVPTDLVDRMIQQKGHHDFGSASLTQQIVLNMLESGTYDRHVAVLRDVYSHKLKRMLELLEEELVGHAEVTWTRPKGGLYVWVSMPEGLSTSVGSKFFRECLAAGVLYVPGGFCYPEDMVRVPDNQLRLSFGHQTIERCEEGLRRLAGVIRRHSL